MKVFDDCRGSSEKDLTANCAATYADTILTLLSDWKAATCSAIVEELTRASEEADELT